MKNSTTAFDKFLSPYKTKENLAKENRNTKTYELSFVTELCNTYSNDVASAESILFTFAINPVRFAMTNDSTIFAPYDNRKIE